MESTPPVVTLSETYTHAELCLAHYGNGRWNYASLCMAGYIQKQHDQVEFRKECKARIYQCIGLLQSMVSCGEDHSDTSRLVIQEAKEALEKL